MNTKTNLRKDVIEWIPGQRVPWTAVRGPGWCLQYLTPAVQLSFVAFSIVQTQPQSARLKAQ